MRRVALIGILFVLFLPGPAKAAPLPFEVTAWIPYWRADKGMIDAFSHLQSVTSLMPFGYIVQDDGSLHDAFGLNNASSTATSTLLFAAARAAKVKIIPTVMWSDSVAMDHILRSTTSRIALEDAITALVKENNFDGIDIDFESKFSQTRPYFSLFLKGLYMRMGKKFVYCTIEPRTPPSSAYTVIPDKINYANDFVAFNKYCDRVQIMTYDQGTIDLKLNAVANAAAIPYVPVADVKWVEKVITLAAQTISKNKIIIGVPTYGYEYDLIPLSQGYRYARHWSFNPRYATDIAQALGITPIRNAAGEMSFTYAPTTTPQTASAMPDPPRIVWWSDAGAINDKILLAQKLGVRGIAIFKIDGGEDSGLWDILPTK